MLSDDHHPSWIRRLGVATAAASLMLVGVGVRNAAAAPRAGSCTVAAAGGETFNQAVTTNPAPINIGLLASGPCLPLGGYSVTIGLAFVSELSCEAGEGSGAGNVLFSNNMPTAPVVTNLIVTGPGTMVIEFFFPDQPLFVGEGTITWSAADLQQCLTSGITAADVTGTFTFAEN